MKRMPIFILVAIFVLVAATAAFSISKGKSAADYINEAKGMPDANKIVLVVNGNEITKAEYMIALKMQEDLTASLKTEKENIALNAPAGPEKEKALANIDKKLVAGEEKRALSYFLTEYALVTEAKKLGIEVSEQKAKDYAKQTKEKYQQNKKQGMSSEIDDFIAAMGEKTYWEDYVPKKYQIKGSIGKLKNHITGHVDKSEKQKVWNDYVIDVTSKARFEVKDTNLIKLTKKDIIDYKKNYIEE